MSDQMLMKDGLGLAAIERISKAFGDLDDKFNQVDFIKSASLGIEEFELKQRVQHVITVLKGFLDPDFKVVAKQLKKVPLVWDWGDRNHALSGFAAWPVIDYVAEAGIEHPKLALQCLEKLTPLFSAEFAIRPFIERYPELCFEVLDGWLDHKDEHVRRLVSEGTRPRLPWGKQLKSYIEDPEPILPILSHLKADPSLYVRRSVANNLNDISKDHPERVIAVCKNWQNEMTDTCDEDANNITWVIKHATRTLVKQGHPDSFSLLGYTDKPKLEISNFTLDKSRVIMGEDLQFELEIESLKNKQSFVVDYNVYYQKAKGSQSSKVFKLKNVELSKGQSVCFSKKISFKPITTRRYYSGEHAIGIMINGVEKIKLSFYLES